MCSCRASLAPSLRVGYLVAAPAVIDALLNHKMVSGLTSSPLNEQLALNMLTDSGQRRHLQKLRARLLAANLAARAPLEAMGWPVFATADASLFLWLRLPDGIDAVTLTEAALQQDILLAPGVLFRVDREPTPWLRCNVAHMEPRVHDFLAHYAS